MNPSIFKAYDIRGVFGEDFDAQTAERVGRAVVVHTKARRVVVGRDVRVSSPELAAAVIRGVTAQGAEVLDIGLCTTPMFNVAVASDADAHAGVMVSASHNPAKYNGFKLDYADALPISSATGMDEIKRLVMEGVFDPPPPLEEGRGGKPLEEGRGGKGGRGTTVGPLDTLPAYLSRIFSLEPPSSLKPFRMVVDCGNGMGGLTMPAFAERIPGTIEKLYWDLDGTFPNHEPNPIKPENVVDLIAAVRESKADIGFAYDGDADRIGVVDDRGVLVRGDLLTVLLARDALTRAPGATILYDLRSSRVVAEEVERAGGVPVPTRVGHALIKKHLREVGAVFAGELSNHFYFREVYGVESTELAMLRLLRIMTESGKRISDLITPLERYHHSGEVNFGADDKDAVLRDIESRYAPHARAVSKLDGLSMDMGEWWFNIRPSNTEPLLRLVVETPTQRETEEKVGEIGGAIGA